MKTTDSVIREKLKEIMSTPAYPTAPACPYCDFAKGRDYSKTGIQHHIRKAHPGKENTRIDRIVELFSHSLAEARREDLRRVKYLLETYVWDGNIGDGLAKDGGHDYLIEIMENRKLLTKEVLDLLTGDNPERKV